MARVVRILAAAIVVFSSASWASSASRVDQVFRQLGVDTSHTELPLTDIHSGGPPPQGIPALGFSGDARGATAATPPPSFITAAEASTWLDNMA